MLSRLASGAEISSSILIVTASHRDTLAYRSLVSLLLRKTVDNLVLVRTGPSVPDKFDKTEFSQVIDVSDSLGWVSGKELVFPNCVLDKISPGDQSVVIDNLTDLLIFFKHPQVTNFVRKIRQTAGKQSKLVAVFHKNCFPEPVLDDVRKFFNTIIDITDLSGKKVVEKLCAINHLKPGGKLVYSKEILRFTSDRSVKVLPFEESVKKTFEQEEELVDNLTTFNLETTKEQEKKAKDNLVLPFYKDPQLAGQVKIQGQGQSETKSETKGKIYYEPDSGDDWDDEDPDDDLDF